MMPRGGDYDDGAQRTSTTTSFIELVSRHSRETVITKIITSKLTLLTPTNTPLKIARARTQFQRARNYAMRKAKELLDKYPLTQNQTTTIDWTMPTRTVNLNNTPLFSQGKLDLTGTFTSTYAHLTIP